MARGYSFDYISDAQLAQTRAVGGQLATPGARYKVLLVPAARRMPAATLQQIVRTRPERRDGGVRVAAGGRSRTTAALPNARAQFQDLLKRDCRSRRAPAATEARVGDGRILRGSVIDLLPQLPAVREPIADTGVGFIRRAHPQGHDYFLANLTADSASTNG